MPTELLSLAKIFNNRLFRIPDYQRGYAWGEQQLSDFWFDLQRVSDEKTHYCGQLTLEKADKGNWQQWIDDKWLIEDADYEPYFVVDGQQRLTTAVVLLQCLLETLSPHQLLAGQKVSELRERYLAKGEKLLKSCLFGYAKDNPSHEFFRTQILGVPSNEYHGTQTVYTANLAFARDYFRKLIGNSASRYHIEFDDGDELTIDASKIKGTTKLGKGDKVMARWTDGEYYPGKIGRVETAKDKDGLTDIEQLFKVLTQRLRFNIHELNEDIDVFVAFETMNNRGKPLSKLELLKNRLIYLSTLADGSDGERKKVRANINAVWRTVYEELGKNPQESLDDDDFLRAHWIVFFGYDKDEADPLTRFLLNKHFTTERLTTKELTLEDIQKYADNLQISVRLWQRLHFPEDNEKLLGKKVTPAIIRLKRLGFGVLRPMLLAALSQEPEPEELLPVLNHAERFLLLVRSFAGARSNVGESESYRLAHELHEGDTTIADAASMLDERVKRHFSTAVFQTVIDDLYAEEDGKGFYNLPGLSYVLFEYEDHLRRVAKATESKIVWDDFRGSRKSVEHVYPQVPEESKWPLFKNFDEEQKRFLKHCLGNLVAVSVAKNASLSRRSFKEKKKGTDTIPSFSQGSFSELKIAQLEDWTPPDIQDRGLELLGFIENRWKVNFGSKKEKIALLKLEFISGKSSD